MEAPPPLSVYFMSSTSLITQTDLECTLGGGDVPGDILGTLVPLASASIVLRLESFGTQLSQKQADIYDNRVLNRSDT